MVSRFELGRHGPPVLDAALVAKQTQTCKGLDVLIDRLSTPGLTRIFHFLQAFFCEFLAEVHSSFNDCERNASGLHRGYRILLTGSCLGVHEQGPQNTTPHLLQRAAEQEQTARKLVQEYCRHLYAIHGNYNEVARRVELDRRTVEKYVTED